MKKHAIIPIFIPHKGCPNDCVFCNQRKITARSEDVTREDISKTVDTYMSTLGEMNVETIELSFFGGSFTGIPMEEQREYLAVAKEYKDSGIIQKIHLSTRPDYINREILDNLKSYSVDVIELGVQSFAEPVLKASGRGHNASCVYEACRLIKEYGFTLGIQLMIGLPDDTYEFDVFSAKEAVSLGPDIARLYPTVVIKDTALWDMMECGKYVPMAEEDAVMRTAAMYKILTDAGINVIRVGLKSSDIISDDSNTAGTFHPAFRQLVEGFLAKESLEKQVNFLYPNIKDMFDERYTICPTAAFISNAKCYNNMFGHGGENRKYFESEYPRLNIRYMKDSDMGLSLKDNEYLVKYLK
ncbi:MAG: radical SAM protein [Firmicutes bacterium]|nr:radical SAM protein [Bacillota bacterium]